VINGLRKEVDKLQVEFGEVGKRVPLQFSSRHYDFKHSKLGVRKPATSRWSC